MACSSRRKQANKTTHVVNNTPPGSTQPISTYKLAFERRRHRQQADVAPGHCTLLVAATTGYAGAGRTGTAPGTAPRPARFASAHKPAPLRYPVRSDYRPNSRGLATPTRSRSTALHMPTCRLHNSLLWLRSAGGRTLCTKSQARVRAGGWKVAQGRRPVDAIRTSSIRSTTIIVDL